MNFHPPIETTKYFFLISKGPTKDICSIYPIQNHVSVFYINSISCYKVETNYDGYFAISNFRYISAFKCLCAISFHQINCYEFDILIILHDMFAQN